MARGDDPENVSLDHRRLKLLTFGGGRARNCNKERGGHRRGREVPQRRWSRLIRSQYHAGIHLRSVTDNVRGLDCSSIARARRQFVTNESLERRRRDWRKEVDSPPGADRSVLKWRCAAALLSFRSERLHQSEACRSRPCACMGILACCILRTEPPAVGIRSTREASWRGSVGFCC